jgi:hypothetical protein
MITQSVSVKKCSLIIIILINFKRLQPSWVMFAVIKTPSYCPILKPLRWLKIKERIYFNVPYLNYTSHNSGHHANLWSPLSSKSFRSIRYVVSVSRNLGGSRTKKQMSQSRLGLEAQKLIYNWNFSDCRVRDWKNWQVSSNFLTIITCLRKRQM